MSNYLTNVAHRAAGASLLRPRVPSRFEPIRGMTPAMDHFREVVTERVAERVSDSPRVTQVSEARLTPPPTPSRVSETPVRREEARATTHTLEERAVNRKKPEIDQPHPLPEFRTQDDSVPNIPTAARILQPEITQKPADTHVLISRDVLVETVQPRQEPTRRIVEADAPVTVPSVAPHFPTPRIEKREQPDRPERLNRPERRTPVMKAESQLRNREFAVTPAPASYAQPAGLRTEIAAPSIHVTIGKVTVQATLPSGPVQAPARTPAHNGPRLTLERYLDRRGGRL